MCTEKCSSQHDIFMQYIIKIMENIIVLNYINFPTNANIFRRSLFLTSSLILSELLLQSGHQYIKNERARAHTSLIVRHFLLYSCSSIAIGSFYLLRRSCRFISYSINYLYVTNLLAQFKILMTCNLILIISLLGVTPGPLKLILKNVL